LPTTPTTNLPLATTEDSTFRLRLCVYVLTIAVAAGAGLADILTVEQPMQSANDRSRWATIWTLVDGNRVESDHGPLKFNIDAIIQVEGWDTIDKVRKDGKFYSSKPPLLSTLVAGVYWVVQKITGLRLLDDTRTTIAVILILVNWLPWLIALGLIANLAERFAGTDIAKITLVISAAFGTLLSPFLVTLNNHSMAAVALVVSLWCVLPLVHEGRRHVWRFALGGLAAAFVVCNEMPAAIFGAALFFLLVFRAPAKTCLVFVPAACVALGAFLYTNYLCTGSWKPFQMQYGTEIYRYVYEGVPSYWMKPGGIDQSTERPAVYFLNCVFGHHGIWSLSPILLLTFPGWWIGLRRPGLWRTICGLSLGLTIWVLAFYLTRTQNYNYGGNTAGLRWAFWLIPLWLLTMVPALEVFGERRGFVWLSGLLLSVSVFSAALPRDNPWHSPWLLTVMERWHWVDYRSPPDAPPPTRQIWLGKLPLKPGAFVEFRSDDANGPTTLRIELVDFRDSEQGRLADLRLQRKSSPVGQPVESETIELVVKTAPFDAGESVAKCVVNGSDHASRLLTGLPAKPVYQGRTLRYLKTGLRTDAFHCWRGVANVAPSVTKRRFRRDVWWTEDLPFGVLQFEDTVTNGEGAVVYKQHWVVSDFWNP